MGVEGEEPIVWGAEGPVVRGEAVPLGDGWEWALMAKGVGLSHR